MSNNITIDEALLQLEEFGFEKRVDTIAEYSQNADLYIRKIDEERYIILHHFNKNKHEELQGFDCWISTYRFDNHIGRIPAIEMEEVKKSFDFVGDWKLIAKHLLD
jgi:hypothetical protein